MSKKLVKKKPSRRKQSPVEVDLNEDTRRLGARFSVKKGLSLNDFPSVRHGAVSIKNTTPTYVYLGHGNEFSYRPDKVVPAGCTLSTITESSLGANLEAVILLTTLAQTHKHMVTQPLKHYHELFDLYKGAQYNATFQHKNKLLEGEFHLKQVGDAYQNKSCTFILEFYNETRPGSVSIFRSGLYDINTPGLKLPRIDGDELFDKASIDFDKKTGLTVANIKELYRGSVYPRVEDILENVKKNMNDKLSTESKIQTLSDEQLIPFRTFQYAMHDSVNMKVDQLMERFPGNHYFFICRELTPDVAFKESYTDVQAHRKASKNKAEALLGKPIEEVPPYGLNLKAQQHFMRQIQKVFIELYKSDKGVKEAKGQAYGEYETEVRKEITQEYGIMMDTLIEYFEEFIDDKGKASPYIVRFCNAIIQMINDNLRIHPHTFVHIDKRLVALIVQAQQFEEATRIDLDSETIRDILNR